MHIRVRLLSISLLFLSGQGYCFADQSIDLSQSLPLFDSHSHYKTEDAGVLDHQQILAKMDKHNISHMVNVGEPPQRTQALYHYAPDRIIPFLGLYENDANKADWMHDDQLINKLEQLLKQGTYKGLGEVHLFRPHKDNENFAKLLALADANDLPVLFHGDQQLVEHIMTQYPDMTVIWAHLGTRPEPEILAAMLDKFPERLYVDTSVRDERFTQNGRLLQNWYQFFMAYQDRILIAIDTFYTPRWENIGAVTGRIRQWLSQLPQEVARKLAYQNAQTLFLSESSD